MKPASFHISDKKNINTSIRVEWGIQSYKSLDELFEERQDDDGDLSFEMEEHYLKDVKNGFFIEAGASEGIIPI